MHSPFLGFLIHIQPSSWALGLNEGGGKQFIHLQYALDIMRIVLRILSCHVVRVILFSLACNKYFCYFYKNMAFSSLGHELGTHVPSDVTGSPWDCFWRTFCILSVYWLTELTGAGETLCHRERHSGQTR